MPIHFQRERRGRLEGRDFKGDLTLRLHLIRDVGHGSAIRARVVDGDTMGLFECSTITHMGYLILWLGSKYDSKAHTAK